MSGSGENRENNVANPHQGKGSVGKQSLSELTGNRGGNTLNPVTGEQGQIDVSQVPSRQNQFKGDVNLQHQQNNANKFYESQSQRQQREYNDSQAVNAQNQNNSQHQESNQEDQNQLDNQQQTNVGEDSAPVFDFNQYREHFKLGESYQNEDEFRSDLSQIGDYKKSHSEYAPLKERFEASQGELESLKSQMSEKDDILNEIEGQNPLGILKPEQFKAFKLTEKYPHMDGKILANMASNIDTMDPFELLANDIVAKSNGRYSMETAKKVLAKESGLDYENRNEWGQEEILSFELKADAVRGKYRDEMASIELPKQVNLDRLKEARSQRLEENRIKNEKDYSDFFGDMLKEGGIKSKLEYKDNDLDINHEFSFDYNDEFRNDTVKGMIESYAKAGVELTNDNMESIKSMAQGVFIQKNFNNIIDSITKQLATKFNEHYIKDLHNPEVSGNNRVNNNKNTGPLNQSFLKKAPFSIGKGARRTN